MFPGNWPREPPILLPLPQPLLMALPFHPGGADWGWRRWNPGL